MATEPKEQIEHKNVFSLAEFAGACGDLGTLIPFVLVYISIMKFDPVGLLLGFGIFNIITGLLYKTPVPVQPMKAIATFSTAHASQITQGMISGAGLFSGIFWILLAATGSIKIIEKFIKQTVVKGILLGLGMTFMVEGTKMMVSLPWLAISALILYFAFYKRPKIPVILIIMLFGMVASVIMNPQLLNHMMSLRPSLSLPSLNFPPFHWKELLSGVLLLAIPQIPLTLGNGVIALVAENNELFPDKKTSAVKISMTTGLMNVVSPFWHGVPMCHGAGGMAGHVRFGARTGGATIILGIILVGLALFFGGSLTVLLQLIPQAILGVIMFLAGAELASSAYNKDGSKQDYFVTVVTAGVVLYNTGIALLVGLLLERMTRVRQNAL